ncbi:MAG: LPS assembly lipoprotein LptE [Candidatus Binataceae bacterium]
MKSLARRSPRRLERIGALIAFAIAAAGCGYQFAAGGSGLPAQAKTIYVEKFDNHTRYTGLDDQFMRYLKDEIADRKRLALVDQPDQADLLLAGEVLTLQSVPVATNAVGEPITYEDSLGANATLTDAHTHQVIWRSNGISASEQTPVIAGAVITTSPKFLQQNLRAQDIGALPDLQLAQTQQSFGRGDMMASLAQNLYASMSEGF